MSTHSQTPSNTDDVRGTAAVVADEIKRLAGFEMINTGGVSRAMLAVVPEGKKVQDLTTILDQYLPKPLRRRGTATLTDAASFIEHVKRFASGQSAVFANPERQKPALTVVFDYHPEGEDATQADNLTHRGVYAPALSDEWKAWTGNHGKPMSQADFAAFIEDRITDVIVPNLDDPNIKTFAELVQGRFAEPSDLLALSRGLAINVETSVKNALSLTTGEISVVYDEQHRDGAGAPINIANLFQICIPVFYAGSAYRMAVRLRYRLSGGKIAWSFLLVRPDLVFDDAFRGIVSTVTKETGVPVFLGSPEAPPRTHAHPSGRRRHTGDRHSRQAPRGEELHRAPLR
jgi:uncharacterized protein YfdQ (DUF2303 family)